MSTLKALVAASILLAVSISAEAQVYVDGYTKRDGTYVAGHYRSAPNSNKADNYSAKGNYNPYTGQRGTVDPYAQPSYQQPARYQPVPAYQPPPAYTPPQAYSPRASSYNPPAPQPSNSWYEPDSD